MASISILFSPPKREIIGDICLLRQKIVFLLWKCILECRKARLDCARKEQRTSAVLVAFSSVSRHHFLSIECATKEHRNPAPRGSSRKTPTFLEKSPTFFGKSPTFFLKRPTCFFKTPIFEGIYALMEHLPLRGKDENSRWQFRNKDGPRSALCWHWVHSQTLFTNYPI